jgi:hypothetical protein
VKHLRSLREFVDALDGNWSINRMMIAGKNTSPA